jgi:hypothetical protein
VIHLIKLCVGVSSVEELQEWRAERKAQGLGRPDGLNAHRTRMTPKRAGEIAGQGSLYWVIAGTIQGRQPIAGFEPGTDEDGRPHCKILMKPGVIRTVPQPKRPFQGWRYLDPKDAPADLEQGTDPEGARELVSDLARLGLI